MGHGLLQHLDSARHVGGHVIHLRYEDGVEGDVDIRNVIGEFCGVLAPLTDPAFVAKVFVNEQRTVSWPGDLDLDPIVLYCATKGIPVPDFEALLRATKRRSRRTHRGAGKASPAKKPAARKSTRGLRSK